MRFTRASPALRTAVIEAHTAVRAEAARWIVLGIGWFVTVPTGLLPMCALWSTAALAAAAVFAWHTRPGATRGIA